MHKIIMDWLLASIYESQPSWRWAAFYACMRCSEFDVLLLFHSKCDVSGTIFIIAKYLKIIVICQFRPPEHESKVRFENSFSFAINLSFKMEDRLELILMALPSPNETTNKNWFLVICDVNRGIIFFNPYGMNECSNLYMLHTCNICMHTCMQYINELYVGL